MRCVHCDIGVCGAAILSGNVDYDNEEARGSVTRGIVHTQQAVWVSSACRGMLDHLPNLFVCRNVEADSLENCNVEADSLENSAQSFCKLAVKVSDLLREKTSASCRACYCPGIMLFFRRVVAIVM